MGLIRPPTIEILEAGNGGRAGEPQSVELKVTIGEETSTDDDLLAESTVNFYVSGPGISANSAVAVNDISDGHPEGSTFTVSGSVTYPEDGTYSVRARVANDFYNETGYTKDTGNAENALSQDETTASVNIKISQEEQIEEDLPPQDFQEVFRDRADTRFKEIEPDGDVVTNNFPTRISFNPYNNPDISVDVSGRFAKHEIIGGVTVRQKIGEDPVQISVRGVCEENVAVNLDKLRNARTADFLSERIAMKVHIASVSTEPLDEGGSVDLDSGVGIGTPDEADAQLLYSYRLNLVGIESVDLPDTNNNG